LWGLLPGGGHFKLKEAGLGLAVAGLILSALAFGVLMVSGNRRALGFVLLLLGVVAWAISIYDATRFAADNDDAVLLRPRVITAVMGIVFAIVIVAAVSITGEEPIP
jgi:drug/metabolite transporter (DMT)-like permease